nr:group-specific protein [Bacillus paralicheniformis]
MGLMITFEIDQNHLEEQVSKELSKRLEAIEHRVTFWDTKELCKQTNMSLNFIKETFFYDPRFPKYRVGTKWLFPAKECEKFLLTWLAEQPRH